MTTTRTFSRSFAGGEITPELMGRIDLDKMQTGLKTCKNMIVKPHGPVTSRPGFRFLNFCKYAEKKARLLRFQFSSSDSMIIELGDYYARFHTGLGTEVENEQAQITSFVADDGKVKITVSLTTPVTITDAQTVYLISESSTALSGRFFNLESITASTFYLLDQLGNYISSSDITGLPIADNSYFCKVYEVETPYAEADLFDIRYAQSLDVLTLTTQLYPAATLSRYLDDDGIIQWRYDVIDFSPAGVVTVPEDLSATSVVVTAGSPVKYNYVVTAISDDGKTESVASVTNFATRNNSTNLISAVSRYSVIDSGTIGTVEEDYAVFDLALKAYSVEDEVVLVDLPANWSELEGMVCTIRTVVDAPTYKYTLLDVNGDPIAMTKDGDIRTFASAPSYCCESGVSIDLTETGNHVNLKWSRVDGITRYNVYKRQGGSYFYGYIGQSRSARFTDKNITEDVSKSPPELTNYFSTESPAAVTYFEQRKVFAGTISRPQTVWMTKPYTENNLTSSFPLRSDDTIMATASTNEASTIMHAVAMNDIVLLTCSGEMRVSAGNAESLTPISVSVKAQSYVGSSVVQPVLSNKAAIFVEAGGHTLRELVYQGGYESSYDAQNISIMAAHLFQSAVVDLAFMRGSTPIVWAVREDGVLVGATYVPEHRVIAYHQHDTSGLFESIASCFTMQNARSLQLDPDTDTEAVASEYVPDFDADTLALIARMDVDPSLDRKIAIDELITGLKEANVWTKLDTLYVYSAHTKQAALLDWVRHTKTATMNPASTFVADSHIYGGSYYVDMNYNPSTEAVNYALNDASMFLYTDVFGYGGDDQYIANVNAAISSSGTSISGQFNDGDHFWTVANSTLSGTFMFNRTSSANYGIYVNGEFISNHVASSSGIGNGASGAPINGNATVRVCGFGGSMTESEALALHNLIEIYLGTM